MTDEDGQIRDLRTRARDCGDEVVVEWCDRALEGDDLAWAECMNMIKENPWE